MKHNSKKGFTLIELICALCVAVIAITLGVQLFSLSGHALTSGAALDRNTQAIVHFFESQQTDQLVGKDCTSNLVPATMSMTLAGAPVSSAQQIDTLTVTDENTTTSLSIYDASIAGNDG